MLALTLRTMGVNTSSKGILQTTAKPPSVCECVVINESVFVRYVICIIATPHMPSSSLVTHERSSKLPSTSFSVLTNL